MGKKPNDPWAVTTSTFCVLELVQDRGPNPNIAVVLSIPGREGTFTKRWKTVQGRLDEPQVRDLLGWLTLSAQNALVTWTGSQGVLPMD